jgi:hypothetical protein
MELAQRVESNSSSNVSQLMCRDVSPSEFIHLATVQTVHVDNSNEICSALLNHPIRMHCCFCVKLLLSRYFSYLRGPFEKLVDWRQCAAVVQREAVTVMPSCWWWGDVVVA